MPGFAVLLQNVLFSFVSLNRKKIFTLLVSNGFLTLNILTKFAAVIFALFCNA